MTRDWDKPRPKRAKAPSRLKPATPYEPTSGLRAQVEAMAACGIPQEDICRTVINPATGRPLSLKTLLKHFRGELDEGTTKANAKVGSTLFRLAVGAPAEYDGDGKVVRAEQAPIVAAAIFWMKARAGWKERTAHEVSGPGGAPIEHRIEVEFVTPGSVSREAS